MICPENVRKKNYELIFSLYFFLCFKVNKIDKYCIRMQKHRKWQTEVKEEKSFIILDLYMMIIMILIIIKIFFILQGSVTCSRLLSSPGRK